MVKNVGPVDKLIRYILALILLILVLTVVPAGWPTILLYIIIAILIITAMTGFCAPYKLFGINTCEAKPAKPEVVVMPKKAAAKKPVKKKIVKKAKKKK